MKKYKKDHAIGRMAKILNVSRDGYYKYIRREESLTRKENEELVRRIIEIHNDSKKKVYGSPRIHKELKKQGKRCSRKRIANLMKENGIMAINEKGWRRSGRKTYDLARIAPNLLNQNFAAGKANSVWTSDITYIQTGEGWLYLSVVMDLYSRKIVGLSMGRYINTDLIKRSLDQAICHRMPSEGLILHSDRGCQYTSSEYRTHILKHGITLSNSAAGNCYDNAAMESFFSTLKKECVHLCNFKTRQEAMQSIFEYIEVFYNRQRLHSTLDYLSPYEYENNGKNNSKKKSENVLNVFPPIEGVSVPICYV